MKMEVQVMEKLLQLQRGYQHEPEPRLAVAGDLDATGAGPRRARIRPSLADKILMKADLIPRISKIGKFLFGMGLNFLTSTKFYIFSSMPCVMTDGASKLEKSLLLVLVY